MQEKITIESQFKPSDIEVGDEIIFINDHVVQHNLFWKVVYKISNSRLVVEIKEMGFAQKIMIETRDIIQLQKSEIPIVQLSL